MNVLIIDQSKILAESIKKFLETHSKELTVKCFDSFPQNIIKWVDLLFIHIYSNNNSLNYQKLIFEMREKNKRVIAIVESITQDHIIPILQLGLDGLLSANCSFNDIKNAINKSTTKNVYIDPNFAHFFKNKTIRMHKVSYKATSWGKQLTIPEHNIMPLLLKNYSKKEISIILGISEKTVINHINSILEKSKHQSVFSLISYFKR